MRPLVCARCSIFTSRPHRTGCVTIESSSRLRFGGPPVCSWYSICTRYHHRRAASLALWKASSLLVVFHLRSLLPLNSCVACSSEDFWSARGFPYALHVAIEELLLLRFRGLLVRSCCPACARCHRQRLGSICTSEGPWSAQGIRFATHVVSKDLRCLRFGKLVACSSRALGASRCHEEAVSLAVRRVSCGILDSILQSMLPSRVYVACALGQFLWHCVSHSPQFTFLFTSSFTSSCILFSTRTFTSAFTGVFTCHGLIAC